MKGGGRCKKHSPPTRIPYTLAVWWYKVSSTVTRVHFEEAYTGRTVTVKFKHKVVHELRTTGPPLFARPSYHPSEVRSHAMNSTICSARVFVTSNQVLGPVHYCWWQKRTALPTLWRLPTIERRHWYSLPHLHDFTAHLADWTLFTKLDLVKAYHQVPIDEHDIQMTAVTTPFGLFEVTGFGVQNDAQTFQRVVNEILCGLDYALAYIDDVLIALLDEPEHEQQVRAVLKRLQDFGMSINPAKCVFAITCLTFLGHVINVIVKPNPDHVNTIYRWLLLVTKKGRKKSL